MILITRFDNSVAYINPHLIEMLEETPDTMIGYNGKKMVVKESVQVIIERIIKYRRSIGISISDSECSKNYKEDAIT